MALVLTNGGFSGSHQPKRRGGGKKQRRRNRIQRNGPVVRTARTLPREPRINRSEIIARDMPLFQNMRRCQLRYHDKFSLTTGVSAANTYVFSTNGLYDPNITGTGHQPMGFDQMMVFYEHYVVEKSRMTIMTRNNSTTYPIDVAISLNAGSTAATDYTTIVEGGVLVRDRLSPFPYDNSCKTLSLNCDVARFGGVPQVLDNPEYQGTSAANPTEQSYFHIQIWNPEDATQLTCFFEIQIDFVAWFREPREATQSLALLHGLGERKIPTTADQRKQVIELLSQQLRSLSCDLETK